MTDDKPENDEEAPPFVRREGLPPFVQNDDSSNMIAIHAQRRHRINPALYMNNTPLPPLPMLAAGQVLYVDFGFTSVQEYWIEVAEPAYQRFVNDETRANAIMACFALWPLHEWLWHEQHPGQDTEHNKDFAASRQQLFRDCPEMEWIRDAAEAGKHRGLGRRSRSAQVREVAKPNYQPLVIGLKDGTKHELGDVLSRVVEYFRRAHFAP